MCLKKAYWIKTGEWQSSLKCRAPIPSYHQNRATEFIRQCTLMRIDKRLHARLCSSARRALWLEMAGPGPGPSPGPGPGLLLSRDHLPHSLVASARLTGHPNGASSPKDHLHLPPPPPPWSTACWCWVSGPSSTCCWSHADTVEEYLNWIVMNSISVFCTDNIYYPRCTTMDFFKSGNFIIKTPRFLTLCPQTSGGLELMK